MVAELPSSLMPSSQLLSPPHAAEGGSDKIPSSFLKSLLVEPDVVGREVQLKHRVDVAGFKTHVWRHLSK